MTLSNILFDLDGTLIDSKDGITRSIQYALSKLDREVPELNELEWSIGPPIETSFARLLDTVDEKLIGCAVKAFRQRRADRVHFAVGKPSIVRNNNDW